MSRGKLRRASRSASSAKLLEVRIRVVRFGSEAASVDWMLLILLRARSSVRSRGERGKLERAVMSLSVKSMASWSYSDYCSAVASQYSLVPIARLRRMKGGGKGEREGRQWGEEKPLQHPNSQSAGFCVL